MCVFSTCACKKKVKVVDEPLIQRDFINVHMQVLSVVGLLQDDVDLMVSVMKGMTSTSKYIEGVENLQNINLKTKHKSMKGRPNQVLSVVGLLQGDVDLMMSVMKVEKAPLESLLISVLSYDGVHLPDSLAVTAAGIAVPGEGCSVGKPCIKAQTVFPFTTFLWGLLCRVLPLINRYASASDGLDTMVGDHGSHMFGGQKQRIALAWAILKDPRIQSHYSI
ncbi:ABC transporter B family member 11-like protein [Tanacetum coccineum]|uniref:ABC transporter B family member 11-like protein n=1 Tax=Tanacetum coccineum TaxID=301880 RepID=A0ABQ5HD59_9ASTR